MVQNGTRTRRRLRFPEMEWLSTAALFLLLTSCGGTGTDVPPSPPPPPGVTISLMPQAASVPLGGMQVFSAAVNGASDTSVIWQVNGITSGTPSTGTVDANGVFTAPRSLPAVTMVTVAAVSHADATRSARAIVTITSDVAVSIQPVAASVELGAAQSFAAQITGSGKPLDTMTWSVAGLGCSGAACGQITAGGTYTAPQVLPSPPRVTVTATSDADPSKKNSAAINITSRFTVAVSGPASVNPASLTQFTATVTPVPGSNPSTAMVWSVSGAGCSGGSQPCGTISNFGMFTAPGAAPQPNSITITATSVADPSRSASAATQIITQISVSVAPNNATVALEHSQQFIATVNGLANPAVQWSVNGTLGGDATVGTISNTVALNGFYTAPINMVAGRQVTITAQSVADPSISDSVTAALTSSIVVQLSPSQSSRVVGARQAFTATVANTSNPNVMWTVNDVANGSPVLGEICVSGSNPCQPPPLSVAPGSVDYAAPATVPQPPTVTVKAVSVADNLQFASASVMILQQVTVSLSPPSATVPPTGTQAFLATVIGSPDQNVTWDVNGFANGAVNLGLICLPGSNPCQAPAGPMAGPIEYRAPATPPSPSNTVTVSATSELGPGLAQSAAVTVGTGPFLFSLLPASATTDVTQPFTMRVEGVQFVAGPAGTGSTVMFGAAPRATSCPSTTECDVTIDPIDVATAGTILVSVENPGSPPVHSNAVNFVVVPPDNSTDIITLDAANPLAAGKDIVVVEPTTAGSTPPVRLSLQGLGVFDAVQNVCRLGPAIVVVTRPVTGSASFQLCLVGTNLAAVNGVSFSGPAVPDLTAGNLQNNLGNIALAFSLTVPSSSQPGLRSVFTSAVNGDKAALTGSLEVQ